MRWYSENFLEILTKTIDKHNKVCYNEDTKTKGEIKNERRN